MTTVSNDQSFVRFVYAFAFDSKKFDDLIKAANEKMWESLPFPKDDLLPHVARFLNPSDTGTQSTVKMWKLCDAPLKYLAGVGSEKADWCLEFKQPDHLDEKNGMLHRIPFTFNRVELSLFQTGVGFLTIEASPKSNDVNQWLNFIHHFRFIKRKNTKVIAYYKKKSDDDIEEQKVFVPSFAKFNEKTTLKENVKSDSLSEILHVLLNGLQTEAPNWWQEIFIPNQLLPYVVIYVDQPQSDDSMLIYKLRNFFHTGQGRNPGAEDLHLIHPSLLEYADRQWHIFTLDGGSFLACNAPATEFFQVTLPGHLRLQYFLLFTIALLQRFSLIGFSERVSQNWINPEAETRDKIFKEIRNELFNFRARVYFVQLMHREHHQRCYRRWQETFQVDQFYNEVREEIHEMNDYLQTERSARIEQRIEADAKSANELKEKTERHMRIQENKITRFGTLLVIVFGIPSLVFSFLGINLKGVTVGSGIDLLPPLLIALVFMLICLVPTLIYFKKSR